MCVIFITGAKSGREWVASNAIKLSSIFRLEHVFFVSSSYVVLVYKLMKMSCRCSCIMFYFGGDNNSLQQYHHYWKDTRWLFNVSSLIYAYFHAMRVCLRISHRFRAIFHQSFCLLLLLLSILLLGQSESKLWPNQIEYAISDACQWAVSGDRMSESPAERAANRPGCLCGTPSSCRSRCGRGSDSGIARNLRTEMMTEMISI